MYIHIIIKRTKPDPMSPASPKTKYITITDRRNTNGPMGKKIAIRKKSNNSVSVAATATSLPVAVDPAVRACYSPSDLLYKIRRVAALIAPAIIKPFKN